MECDPSPPQDAAASSASSLKSSAPDAVVSDEDALASVDLLTQRFALFATSARLLAVRRRGGPVPYLELRQAVEHESRRPFPVRLLGVFLTVYPALVSSVRCGASSDAISLEVNLRETSADLEAAFRERLQKFLASQPSGLSEKEALAGIPPTAPPLPSMALLFDAESGRLREVKRLSSEDFGASSATSSIVAQLKEKEKAAWKKGIFNNDTNDATNKKNKASGETNVSGTKDVTENRDLEVQSCDNNMEEDDGDADVDMEPTANAVKVELTLKKRDLKKDLKRTRPPSIREPGAKGILLKENVSQPIVSLRDGPASVKKLRGLKGLPKALIAQVRERARIENEMSVTEVRKRQSRQARASLPSFFDLVYLHFRTARRQSWEVNDLVTSILNKRGANTYGPAIINTSSKRDIIQEQLALLLEYLPEWCHLSDSEAFPGRKIFNVCKGSPEQLASWRRQTRDSNAIAR